jgi:hypothetical protein
MKLIFSEFKFFFGSKDMNESLTSERIRYPGKVFRVKLKQFATRKCHPLLFDLKINSLKTILLNVYQMFLVTGIKFYCYARTLPHMKNTRFLIGIHSSFSI